MVAVSPSDNKKWQEYNCRRWVGVGVDCVVMRDIRGMAFNVVVKCVLFDFVMSQLACELVCLEDSASLSSISEGT